MDANDEVADSEKEVADILEESPESAQRPFFEIFVRYAHQTDGGNEVVYEGHWNNKSGYLITSIKWGEEGRIL